MATGVLSEAPFLIIGVAAGLMLLPAQAGGLIGAASAGTAGTSKRKFRVLLAEDSGYGGRSLRRQLERAGHAVHIAGDGDSALDLLHKGGLDVMLIDLHLRNPSALDIVRMYRFMRSEDANLPIVGLAPGLRRSHAQALRFSRNERGAADAGGGLPPAGSGRSSGRRILQRAAGA